MSFFTDPLQIGTGDPFGGIRITWSHLALEETDQRLFPLSKHRSRRIHKKLVKRFGGEFRKLPTIFYTPHGLIAHPALRSQIEAAFEKKRRTDVERRVLGAIS